MASPSPLLKVIVGLLMVVSIVELSFISATVGFLAKRASGTFDVVYNGATFPIAGEPVNLSVNQGHTSNGASGTAFIIIGCCGLLALWLRGRSGYHNKSIGGLFSRSWYRLWLAFNVPALLLTLGALAYTFAVTKAHQGQRIDLSVARRLDGGAYPLQEWTPQNWFDALLKLDLASGSDRDDIESHYKIARGWEFNLIPFFIVQLVQTVLALLEAVRMRKADRQNGYGDAEKDAGVGAP
ncbi:hypothetical protein VP1G_01888 [Cytospora mali]|uniref:Uncharacterized protein n=1 Tax=Cytospora mali TaxID=578113 RepID=A0A194URZ1_CYTMA|nr:hypothetical protein VP1G_01888 [Valsa mali var. pyri (nom. inval.)]